MFVGDLIIASHGVGLAAAVLLGRLLRAAGRSPYRVFVALVVYEFLQDWNYACLVTAVFLVVVAVTRAARALGMVAVRVPRDVNDCWPRPAAPLFEASPEARSPLPGAGRMTMPGPVQPTPSKTTRPTPSEPARPLDAPAAQAPDAVLAVCIAIGPKETFAPIRDTLDSLARQDAHGLEIVVKVAGNHLCDVIADHWTHVSTAKLALLSGDDSGIYDAFNRCVGAATASYVMFLGCGDTLADDSVVADFGEVARDRPASAFYGQVVLADRFGTPLSSYDNRCYQGARRVLPWRNPCHSQGLIYRREWLLEHPFDTTLGPLADLAHTHRHRVHEQAVWIARPLSVFRAGGASNQRSRRAFAARLRGLYAACDSFRMPWLWRVAAYLVAHVDHAVRRPR